MTRDPNWQPEDYEAPADPTERYRAALREIADFQRTAPSETTLSEALDRIEAIARRALGF